MPRLLEGVHVCRLLEHPGRLAGFVALYLAALGVRRLARDAEQLQRPRVNRGDVPAGAARDHRVIGGDPVEVLLRWVASLGELLVVVAPAPDPLALRCYGCPLREPFHHLLDAPDAVLAVDPEPVRPVQQHVQVRVYKAGQQGVPVQVHHPRPWATQVQNLLRRPDRQDLLPLDGDGLRDLVIRVDGDDLAVHENVVRVHYSTSPFDAPLARKLTQCPASSRPLRLSFGLPGSLQGRCSWTVTTISRSTP